jgi:hypothetical protein
VTTIAIDKHGTIAADGLRLWCGDVVSRTEEKLRIRHGRIYALTGVAPVFEPLIAWHGERNADPEKLPPHVGIGEKEERSWTLIVVERPGLVTKYTSTCPYPETFEPPIAFGAGIDLAKGAMWAGASAGEAVRLVAENAEHTGGRIQVIDIAEALGLKQMDEERMSEPERRRFEREQQQTDPWAS